tara:strand:- start:6828 stop:7076 length:249 start_codon:yes stop_codon:yes gene_type:complete
MNNINTYLELLIGEKEGISMDTPIEVEGASGTNFMTVGVVCEHILIAPKSEQEAIKKMLVKIDFANGCLNHFFFYLAEAIAK